MRMYQIKNFGLLFMYDFISFIIPLFVNINSLKIKLYSKHIFN